MKNKKVLKIIFFVLIAAVLLAITFTPVNCIKIRVLVPMTIYSESGLATNITAKIYPNDVIFLCKEEK